jgi:hypothetical protein
MAVLFGQNDVGPGLSSSNRPIKVSLSRTSALPGTSSSVGQVLLLLGLRGMAVSALVALVS